MYTAGRNLNWYSCVESRLEVSQKTKIEIPYDAAIPFQAIYIKMVKTGLKEIYVHTCP